jgi:hypothetical protein
MNIKALQNNNNLITSLCVSLLLLGVFAYIYFLSVSVVHVVMRKEATTQIGELRSEIARLETSYIEAKHQISARVASLEGFSQNQEKVFISKQEQSLVLRTANE